MEKIGSVAPIPGFPVIVTPQKLLNAKLSQEIIRWSFIEFAVFIIVGYALV